MAFSYSHPQGGGQKKGEIPGEILKGKRNSYWCEDCEKALCVVPCFKIYHTQTDYKLHAKNFRQGVLQLEGVENDDD